MIDILNKHAAFPGADIVTDHVVTVVFLLL